MQAYFYNLQRVILATMLTETHSDQSIGPIALQLTIAEKLCTNICNGFRAIQKKKKFSSKNVVKSTGISEPTKKLNPSEIGFHTAKITVPSGQIRATAGR